MSSGKVDVGDGPTLAELLQHEKDVQGCSLVALAGALGIGVTTLVELLKGTTPKLETLIRIYQFLPYDMETVAYAAQRQVRNEDMEKWAAARHNNVRRAVAEVLTGVDKRTLLREVEAVRRDQRHEERLAKGTAPVSRRE